MWWFETLRQPGPLPESRALVVPRGGTAQLASALLTDGAIRQPLVFRGAAWLSRRRGALHAGEFAFPAHASISQVLAVLRTARPIEHQLTIPEGVTAQQITVQLAGSESVSGDMPPIQEGALLPQTYNYEFGTPRITLAIRAKTAMDKALTTEWESRASGLPLRSPYEALILASIVERETAKPEERGRIAAVYLNRLRRGMRLQADPTVVYFASNGSGVLDHALTRSELDRNDPFNTYRSNGLPPTPICSPGRDSLHAVLHPTDSDDLYFVADGTGGHAFSRDYNAHDAAVARWRALVPTGPQGNAD